MTPSALLLVLATSTTAAHPAEAAYSVAARARALIDAAKKAATSSRPICPEDEYGACTGWFDKDGAIRVRNDARICDGIVQVVDDKRRVVAYVHDDPNSCSSFALRKADGTGYEIEVWEGGRDLVRDPDPTSSCAVSAVAFAHSFPAVLGATPVPTIEPTADRFYVAQAGLALRGKPATRAKITARLAINDVCFTTAATTQVPKWACTSAGGVVHGYAERRAFSTEPVAVEPPIRGPKSGSQE